MRACGNLFEVSAANAAGMHAHEHFSGADCWNGHYLKADVIDPAVDGGLHSCGDYVVVGLDGGLSGGGHEVILDDGTRPHGANTNVWPPAVT